MRVSYRSVLKISATLALVSCGKAQLSHNSGASSDSLNLTTLSHNAWCSAWNLSCPAPKAPDPNSPEPLTKAQIDSLLRIGRSIGNSPSKLTLSRSELDAPAITSAVATLGLNAEWTSLRNRLDYIKFSNLSLGQAGIAVTNDAAATKTGASGLSVQTAPQISIDITADQCIAIKGLALASPNGQSATLDRLTLNGGDTADWQDQELSVTQAPLAFIGSEILDVEGSAATVKKDLAFKDLVPLIVPLVDWIDSGSKRDINLGRSQIDALQAELRNLVKDDAAQRNLTAVLRQIQQVQSTGQGRRDHLLQITANNEIRCSVDGKVDFTLAKSFGLKRIARSNGDDGTLVTIQVEGFRITLPGPFSLPVSISRIELAPTKIWIRDLPIIGSISVDVSSLPKDGQSGTTPPKISCS
ncbi:MAG: hypothetical protein NTZ90_13005 [Proteobacteria bacterium]|nr:hypothetical protein [Pseudomonadota bacterium]